MWVTLTKMIAASPLNIRRSHVTIADITTKSGSSQQNSRDICNKHVDIITCACEAIDGVHVRW
jgi:hypothetical protein